VYVEEVSGGIKPIEGVGTSTGAFIGVAERGPVAGAGYEDGPGRPVLVTSFGDFGRTFGGFIRNEFLAYAVQQFFNEGGTRCYIARTAHFTDPSDPTTLTARRATVPLGGISTTLTAALAAGATQAQLASVAGIQTGMILYITDNSEGARVRVTGLPGGNAVDFQNTVVDAIGNPVAIPAIANGARVTQVILDVNAIDEGEWGNSLRISVGVAGRVGTTLSAALTAGATQATVASLGPIVAGMTLFVSDGTNAARVQVTRVEEALNRISFRNIQPATTPAIANGANVTGTVSGKASTVLDGAVASGATEAVLLSTEGIRIGSILLFVSEDVAGATLVEARVVVTRLVGKRVFFTPALAAAFPDGATVSSEDFTLTVYDGNDVVETFPNLTMENANLVDYVENRINLGASRSRYIRVREAPLVAGNLPPTRTALPLRLGALPTTGGTDGGDDNQGDYIGNQASQTGFHAFDTVDDVNILAAPGITLRPVILAGMTYCENRTDCFFVGEITQAAQTVTEVLDFKNGTGPYAGQQALVSKYGALYWPWVRTLDPLSNRPMSMPPSGAVIGTYAATDVRRGVHKPPAGIDDGFLNTVVGIEKVVTKGEHDLLNPQGINVIRALPNVGIVLWGARTVSSDPEWRYINVRRLFLFLEESIEKGTQWVVFEPNDSDLWKRIERNVGAFLRMVWRSGALIGEKEEQAFYVKCDAETNPKESVDMGRVITEVGVAPVKPAEFVIFRIAQWDGGSSVSE
jgi:phage tail sheath protein FI